MKTFFGVAIGISIILVAASISYYFLQYLPQKDNADRELEWQKKAADIEVSRNRQNSLDNCIEAAHNHYASNWSISCEVLSLPKECNLPSEIASGKEKLYKDEQELCIKKWK